MPAGRPSKYDPSFCDLVIEWGAEGKSVAWMAANLDVSKDTIYQWVKDYPEFSDSLTRARTKAQAYWEDAGQNGMTSKEFNASIWSRSMAARFPEDWREKSETAVTGAGGGPLEHAITLEVKGVSAHIG